MPYVYPPPPRARRVEPTPIAALPERVSNSELVANTSSPIMLPVRPPAETTRPRWANPVADTSDSSNAVGIGTRAYYGRPPVPPREGYLAEAKQVLGEQKKRGLGQVLKDVALGFAGGGIGGAIAGGVKGGDYAYQNKLAQTVGDLREADQQRRLDQAEDDKQAVFTAAQEENAFERELKRQANERANKQVALQEKLAGQKNAGDLIVGQGDDGGYTYYERTPGGLKPTGVGAPLPKSEQTKALPPNKEAILAKAGFRADQRFRQMYPGGIPNPEWVATASAFGYDPSKQDNDPTNQQAIQQMSIMRRDIKRFADPRNSNEYKSLLDEEASKLYDEYERGAGASAPQPQPRVAPPPVSAPQRTPEYIAGLREQYKKAAASVQGNPKALEYLRQQFRERTGQDLDAALAAAPPPTAEPEPVAGTSRPRYAAPPKAKPQPEPSPKAPEQKTEVGKYVWARPPQAPTPVAQPTESKPVKYDPEQTRLATEEYERIVTNQNLPPKSAQQVYDYLRKKYPNAKYISKSEAISNQVRKLSGILFDPNAPDNREYFQGVR